MEEEHTDPGSATADDLGVRPEVAQRLLAIVRGRDPAWTGTDVREAVWKLIGDADALLGDAGRGYGLPHEDQEDIRDQALLSVVDALLRGIEIVDLEHFTRRQVRFTAVDLLRRRRTIAKNEDEVLRTMETESDCWRTEILITAREAKRVTQEVLSGLSERHREVLVRSAVKESDSEVFRSLGLARGAGRELLRKAEAEFIKAARARGIAPLLVFIALRLESGRIPPVPMPAHATTPRAAIATLLAMIPGRGALVGAVGLATIAGGAVVAQCPSHSELQIATGVIPNVRQPASPREPIPAMDVGRADAAQTYTEPTVSASEALGGRPKQTGGAAVNTTTFLPALGGKLTWDFQPTMPIPTEWWCVQGVENAAFDWNGCYPTEDTCLGYVQHAPSGRYDGCVRDVESPSDESAAVVVTARRRTDLTPEDLRASVQLNGGCVFVVAEISAWNPTSGWVVLSLAPDGLNGMTIKGQNADSVQQMGFHAGTAPASALVPGNSTATFFAWGDHCGTNPLHATIAYSVFGAEEIAAGRGQVGRIAIGF